MGLLKVYAKPPNPHKGGHPEKKIAQSLGAFFLVEQYKGDIFEPSTWKGSNEKDWKGQEFVVVAPF